jgi:23S rRNA pseudouridine1911/1915/1917 synthase
MDAIDIIYEDDLMLVVNKPAGLAVHEDGRGTDPVLTDWVRRERPSVVGVGEHMTLQNGIKIDRPGVVHRLDRDTSGVLVLAKTQDAFLHLKAQFHDRKTEKLYHAIVWGELHDPVGTIDRPIGRSKKDFRLWTVGSATGKKVRSATTRYTVLSAGGGFSYVAVEPKTGRTHQIRVHMKSIGHPVVCDLRYAPTKGCALGLTRLALHAESITLTHPEGERMSFNAPVPEAFLQARATIAGASK